eukprot:CAMPEP_0172802418 /NCGR_PEP_ID=MMETSP1075-20121228/3890_1 /TAXON_ID=2916 /ORGANISM="Ceratium fusus, Strain PA161109" /LENGTH=149 /DNA_ID=CAMNT_0013640699 /DNA_START=752 /DNA_END=1201 /DNA_ORIENTATION=+
MSGHACLCDGSNRRWPERDLVTFLDSKAAARACAAMCASSACVVSLSAARSVAVRSQPRPGLSCDGFDLLGKVKNSGQSLAFTSETGTDVQVTAEDTTDLVAAASSFGNHVSTLDGFKKLLEPWSPDDRVEGVAEADRRCSFMAKALLY